VAQHLFVREINITFNEAVFWYGPLVTAYWTRTAYLIGNVRMDQNKILQIVEHKLCYMSLTRRSLLPSLQRHSWNSQMANRHAQISFTEFRVNLSKSMEITVTNYFTSGIKCEFHWANFYKNSDFFDNAL
jgi:hypothetical protein